MSLMGRVYVHSFSWRAGGNRALQERELGNFKIKHLQRLKLLCRFRIDKCDTLISCILTVTVVTTIESYLPSTSMLHCTNMNKKDKSAVSFHFQCEMITDYSVVNKTKTCFK